MLPSLSTLPSTFTPPEPALLHEVWQFPHPPRQEQVEVMGYLDETAKTGGILSPRKRISIEAPVGVGKSPVAVTFAREHGGSILVPQNALQRQYLRDWPDMPHLRGGAHYTCSKGTKDHPSCRRSSCAVREECRAHCPYAFAKDQYLMAKAALTSYAMFLAMLIHTPDDTPSRKWVVLDESHNFDEAVISASEVSFTEPEFMKHTRKPLPTPPGGVYTLEHAATVLSAMSAGLSASIAKEKHETPERLSWELLVDSIENALSEIGNDAKWVSQVDVPFGKDGVRKFWVKPLLPDTSYARYMSTLNVLGLSATPIPSDISKQLFGVDFQSFAVSSPFPVENRLIHYRPVARMSYNNLATAIPEMAKAISQILPQFADKGIIHCNSFKLGDSLFNLFDVPTRKRILLHRSGMNKEDLLAQFAAAPKGAVLMSPSITEGIDLKDDCGRFNIIAKVPFPALGDPWVIQRKDEIDGWYNWKTALAISQATGRTTRHENDWSDTIILDQSFATLYDRNQAMFPKWFTEAVRG